MEINKEKLLRNLDRTFGAKKEYADNVRLWMRENDPKMGDVLEFLGNEILNTDYTIDIGHNFNEILLLILTKSFTFDVSDSLVHQQRCITLAKLLGFSPDIQRFSLTYFANVPSPFDHPFISPKKKQQKLSKMSSVSKLDIVECCYRLLRSDVNYFKNAWKWSKFVEVYCHDENLNSDPVYKLLCNNILALLINMSDCQLNQLNTDIPKDILVDFETKYKSKPSQVHYETAVNALESNNKKEKILWSCSNECLANVEGVMLPIFDVKNYTFFKNHSVDDEQDSIVLVDSAKVNLHSLALGVAAGKAICLSGPVGSGKTTLVNYLSKLSGRVAPKFVDVEKIAKIGDSNSKSHAETNGGDRTQINSDKKNKRKRAEDNKDLNDPSVDHRKMFEKNAKNGFLRIQLGDQTDSKMLLGQYRCTDIPGEFVWQPGVLTQAVMHGYWLLLEDIDSCTQDVCTVLTNLLENNYLSVPGFRDCLQISSGFQLFITLRTNKGSHNQNFYFQLLEKYLYTINILPLSRNELCKIICEKYPKLSTISSRIVDVFLTFSSGCHASDTNQDLIRSNDFETHENIVVTEDAEEMDDSEDKMEAENNLRAVRNSGRLVSTRDLLKLCKRSSPSFSITSSECAYFVFQNAVDLFCSHLIQSPMKTQLVSSIGAKLGIIQSRCEYLSDEYKPEVSLNNAQEIKIGRAVLKKSILDDKQGKRSSTEEISAETVQKRLKIDSSSHLSIYQQTKRKIPNFSFTRLASCILERISMAVHQNEPILLVGETGVGKTSSVQYLSYQTNRKLIVINMNNQSDVSDLVGGFKPVDLNYVIAPLRYEFEALFKLTFNANKNEKFLNNVSVCFNQGEFNVLIRLMLKVVESTFNRKDNAENRSQKDEQIMDRWSTLNVKLLKLNSQLKNSLNISFAFITGSLVNCIKNGDWVLLDEINLASTETLECLSTILEPNGSIVLLEKGDFVPVKRHPDFRIFACMNPSTDIGKKDLPVGIRNRFTEFYVDELVSESDLLILVGDYLNNTGIQKTKVLSIVKLYKKLRAMAQLELNDGLGNRPVYSLRTLCRALTICAKNLCGSVERNLYESFCLSFLTQLDPGSHLLVLNLIQKTLLSNTKAVLSQQIPKPSGEQIQFEGYWIQKGPKEIETCDNYILTESVRENLRDLARIVSIGKLPVLLQGPTSAGKTSLIEYVAKCSGNYCLRINNHEHTDLQEYIGTYMADVSGKLSFTEGILVQAMKNGYWIILDELNLAPSDILEALNRVLDDNRELFIPETQKLVKAHPNFMLFATQNPPGLYGGRKTLSRAFKNRFIELHFSEIPKPELEIILEKRCLIPKSYAQKMVKTMSELQVNRKSTAKGSFTLRDLFRWGNRYTYASSELMENKLYDWNQHLVDEGYLVLSSKIRNEYEVDIIETALFNNFRKKISVHNLYSLHENTSMVTKKLLENIANHSSYDNIVWTLNMRRMAVLTGKALEFNEPVLLVGQTGCGKTTICQILADIAKKNLRILNCHMHTEGADFLGGLRPFRGEQSDADNRQLFEWANGPLILSMTEGNFFLADEISLAEDSVLERLNCVLEPERTILLAEKGGCNENFIAESNQSGEFVIKASVDFQFLATMNPGGDFGKKELSPALRNRFTEIWCRSFDSRDDLIKIAEHALKIGFGDSNANTSILDLATVLIDTVLFIKENIEKFNYSIRDVLAWVGYITKNSSLSNTRLSVFEATLFGLETMFLDSLEMLPHDTYSEIEYQRSIITSFATQKIRQIITEPSEKLETSIKRGIEIERTQDSFGISPFYIAANPERSRKASDFRFTAPTTQQNLFRLLSALSLNKSILLEGPPGVGKTSLIENLATSIGYSIVRINLCEHTDLADLFGTDQPSDDNSLELSPKTEENEPGWKKPTLGAFVWRDGPLLAALKAQSTWILLDELNLAPQSVLEGLNAILDHRGEVYIPELNKTFRLGAQTRIFASQNPLRQGGGRKGLPQSFLNRFTKVYLRKLNSADLCHVINAKYVKYFEELKLYLCSVGEECVQNGVDTSKAVNYFTCYSDNLQGKTIEFDLCGRLVEFSEKLDHGINNLEFGYKGGPFEANLRDILRWCDLLSNPRTGFSKISNSNRHHEFLTTLYEKMKLVYYQRMRTETDKAYIRSIFSNVFNCDGDTLEAQSTDVSLYWTNEKIYLNDVTLDKHEIGDDNDHGVLGSQISRLKRSTPLILATQRDLLKSLAECVLIETPVILCGPSDSGKTKLVDIICTITDKYCNVDTIDDTVTGSFQQIDLNRHLEELSHSIEELLIKQLQSFALTRGEKRRFIELIRTWEHYVELQKKSSDFSNQPAMSEELVAFRRRLLALKDVLSLLEKIVLDKDLTIFRSKLTSLDLIVRNADTLNTGGHFEWVDSKIVRALKLGQYISLEHVNLCSSAILDRLNSVFETNGNLLLSEKGVTAADNNQSECVTRHKRFRAFLTLDPKHGEISRAMRNRCIELSFDRQSYKIDDLKELIFENGVRDVNRIELLLRIHERIRSLTEFSNFNVSHLIKFAFLVAEHLRLGQIERKAVYVSAMEVYVRSSHVDLLGYGLEFYHNKLVNEIVTVLKNIEPSLPEVFNYENVVIRAGSLNQLSIIRLQFEPIRTAINCILRELKDTDVSKIFRLLRDDFKNMEIKVDWRFAKYLVYIFYELSSVDDVELRRIYVNKILSDLVKVDKKQVEQRPKTISIDVSVKKQLSEQELLAEGGGTLSEYKASAEAKPANEDVVNTVVLDENACLKSLLTLNECLFNEISAVKQDKNRSIPWNSHIFPRIRDYTAYVSSIDDQLKLSALLLAHLSISDIEISNTAKLSQIDVVTYSKAVLSQIIPNGLDNDLVTSIYPILTTIRNYAGNIIKNSNGLSYSQYVDISFAYLWCDRLYSTTKARLFAQKSVNEAVVDRLTLHFNWLKKYLLDLLTLLSSGQENLNNIVDFQKYQKKVTNYIKKNYHPLSQIRKSFVKQLTNFMPFYEENQIISHNLVESYGKETNLIAKLGAFEFEELVRRFKIILSDDATTFRRRLDEKILNTSVLSWLNKQQLAEAANKNKEIGDLFTELSHLEESSSQLEEAVLDDMTEEEHKFLLFCNSIEDVASTTDLTSFKLIIAVLPILEYFALRSLNPVYKGESRAYNYNQEFFVNIKSVTTDMLETIKIISDNKFKACEGIWSELQRIINDSNGNTEALSTFFNNLPPDFYKNYSSFVRTLTTKLRHATLTSLAVNQAVCYDFDTEDAKQMSSRIQTQKLAEQTINGPLLTLSVLSTIFDKNGTFKSTGLGDLEIWRSTLNSLSKLVWNNIEMVTSKFNFENVNSSASLTNGKQLLNEIKLIQLQHTGESENFELIGDFQNLIEELDAQISKDPRSEKKESYARSTMHYNSSLINSVMGAIELNLLTYMPLLDPVEKNRLKKTYIEEDQQHLSELISTYDFMKVVMGYKGLGENILNKFGSKKIELKTKHEKYSKKCALRPNECIYGNLVKDVNHFLRTCCHPKTLLNLLSDIKAGFGKLDEADESVDHSHIQSISEIIKRIELWISNAERFEHHTMQRYSIYYRDFVLPIETSISTLKYGLTGLRQCLIKVRDSVTFNARTGQLYRIDSKELVTEILDELVEFPSVHGLQILTNEVTTDGSVNLIDLLENLEHRDSHYFRLIKTKLQEIQNSVMTLGNITDNAFAKLDSTLSVFNQLWSKQEEAKKRRAREEDSLYVNKTRCATEDEEEVIAEEIQNMFPNYVEDDFGEFIQNATLEQIVKKKPKDPATDLRKQDILNDDDIKLICETFIEIMLKYARSNYHLGTSSDKSSTDPNLIKSSYQVKLNVFHQLVTKYQTSLNSSLDDSFYNGMGLLIGMIQENYQLLQLNDNKSSAAPYNFYKDPNLPEIHQTTDLLHRIESRVLIELENWPDHAVLNDIIRIISRIRTLPSISPIVRFSTGFQILRQKVDEWNSVAHKTNHLRDLEIEIAEYIQRWTKLELQCWRESLSDSFEKINAKAYRYWFFIYNLIHEYLEYSDSVASCDLSDFKAVEKCFGDGEVETTEGSTEKRVIKSTEVIKVLKQFIESSNYGEFNQRMNILKSFEYYLHYLHVPSPPGEKKRRTLIAIVHNLHTYYDQFTSEINETIKSIRTPIEKKLKEFVKIESYNKDLSYFSMKNNIARVHRHLHKFLKEFETALQNKISSIFQYNPNQVVSLSSDQNDKNKNLRHESRVTYYMIDIKNFIASQRLKEYVKIETDHVDTEKPKLLSKVDKLFSTSRNIVKQAVLHTSFPTLIHTLDSLVTDQIETCEYLRKLEVDRSQEKLRQKAQAKQILQQKRKGLADAYKTMTAIGLSFRAGVLETSLNPELVNLKISPFSVSTMITDAMKHRKVDQNLACLNQHVNENYSKCVFKLKLLQTVLLTPCAELGLQNLERMKGFAVDLFLLAQTQRELLAESVTDLQQLQNKIKAITQLHLSMNSDAEQRNNYDEWSDKMNAIESNLSQIILAFEQYELLLKCVPSAEEQQYSAISSSNVTAFTKSSEKYQRVKALAGKILESSKSLLANTQKSRSAVFHGWQKVHQVLEDYETIMTDMNLLLDQFCLNADDDALVLSKPLQKLIQNVAIKEESLRPEFRKPSENYSFENIDTELENIIHHVLLSMQNIYKKYSNPEHDKADNDVSQESKPPAIVENGQKDPESNLENDNEDDEEDTLDVQKDHLKGKIHQEIKSDLKVLNLSSILSKLSIIISVIRSKDDEETSTKLLYARKLVAILPIIEQYDLLYKYYLTQLLGAHKISTKMLNVMLTVFIELGTKGFCIPPDLMQDDDGQKNENEEEKGGEGFGLEDGTGEKDVSDQIESEDQLDTAKKPGDNNQSDDKEDADCKEEKGIDMSEDFDSKLQDVEKRGDESDESDQSDDEDPDKQMGETEEGADKLDDQIWGSDEENDENEDDGDEMNDEEDGKGSKEEDDAHNDLDSKNDKKQGESEEGLDSANDEAKEKNKTEKDIDHMEEPDVGEDQINPYHNELEEPPEPEDMDLGEVELDNENDKENNENEEENPFDIDKMKENMEIDENDDNAEEGEEEDNKDSKLENGNPDSDSDEEAEGENDLKNDEDGEENPEADKENPDESNTQKPGEPEPEAGNEDENKEEEEEEKKKEEESKTNEKEDFHESKDKPSIEDNVQAMPDNKDKGSTDQVQIEQSKLDKQNDEMDAQDTGEDKDGVGQAENDDSKSGHQGIADTKETKSSQSQLDKKEKREQRKQGATDEERTISDTKKPERKQLKTVDKISEQREEEEGDASDDNDKEKDLEADEYQHVKDAKKSDKTTLDNATEEQSKKITHDENEEKQTEPEEEQKDENELQLVDESKPDEEENLENIDKMESEKLENSNKPKDKAKKSERSQENCDTKEEGEVEGEIVETHNVPRKDETTAHCAMDVLQDTTLPKEPSNAQILDMKKMYENERMSNKVVHPEQEDFEMWQQISNKMLPNARDLCEQLRLILEPTKCTRLKGDYRTGRRINMKKIIPYIASQFRKDKIWLRRTKPAQRDYKITIAIDDSKSMQYNNSKTLTLQAISLVSQALTLLESGRLSILSFGEAPRIIRNHSDQFDGPKLVNSLNFSQNQSRIAELLDFTRVAVNEDNSSGSDNGIFENLLLILSDGRNIFSEGEQKVRNAIKLARLQRIFIVYIIIDNPENKHSILDIRVPIFAADRKTITMKSYLDTFPFPYYVIVRDLAQLPTVLSDAMRQWFELVSSEQ